MSVDFYTLREDILPILELIERERPLQYIRTGNQLKRDFPRFTRAAELPSLGSATADSGVACDTYVVAPADSTLRVRTLQGMKGENRYLMDQLINPETVALTPAGLWGSDTVLAGRVGTASNAPVARQLMSTFRAVFKKSCTKVNACWVGPRALDLLKRGKRLTAAVQSPPEFDLREES